MDMEPPWASYWLAAAESGFARRDDWAGWADTYIARAESPPHWVLDLSLATSLDDLWRILTPQIDQESQQGFHREELYDAVLGYLWLRLERGDFDLRTCLDLAGRHADAYETSTECETFFSLLNRLEAGDDVQDAAKAIFEPFREIANRQWATLLSRLTDNR
jgi:hypothetical protein